MRVTKRLYFLLLLAVLFFSFFISNSAFAATQLYAEILPSPNSETLGYTFCVNFEGLTFTSNQYGNGHRGTYPNIDSTDPTGNSSTAFDCENGGNSGGLWRYFSYASDDIPANWIEGDYWIDWLGDGEYYSLFHFNGTQWSTEVGFPSITFSFADGFNNVFNTRFLSATTTGDILYVDYILDEDEVIPTNPRFNPTLVKFSYSKQPTNSFTSVSQAISNSNFATSTVNNDFSSLSQGLYDVLIQFSNHSSLFDENLQPFPDSYVYLTLDVTNQGIQIIGDIELYDSNTLLAQELRPCRLDDLEACLIGAAVTLFVPSQDTVNSITATVVDSEFPLVENFYDAFSAVQSSVENSSPASTQQDLALNLTIPGTSIDVEMFSVDRMTYLMGDTKDTFRGIAEFALWIGFILMVAGTINRMISYFQTDKLT
jgi:hypothetical protein